MTPLPCMNSIFLSTSSARRTTYRGFLHSPGLNISIHVLRKEDDPGLRFTRTAKGQFLSTSSARRTTRCRCSPAGCRWDFYPRPPQGGRRFSVLPAPPAQNFYPRPPRGGRREGAHKMTYTANISIHVLREEDDCPCLYRPECSVHHFYPRPPRGGRRLTGSKSHRPAAFLSTSSARRTTSLSNETYVNGEISIHVLREEDDVSAPPPKKPEEKFLSTSSARRTTEVRAKALRN